MKSIKLQEPSIAKSEEVVEVAKNLEAEPVSINEQIDDDVTVKGVKLGEQVNWPHMRSDCVKVRKFQVRFLKGLKSNNFFKF